MVPYCANAKALPRAKDLEWRELDVSVGDGAKAALAVFECLEAQF